MEADVSKEGATWGEDRPGAGAAARADDDEGGNAFLQLRSQIQELGRRHDQVMSTLAGLSTGNTRSYVYIPREKQIVPYCGDASKDCQTVDEFIEELERVIHVRGLSEEDQVDFILSHLRGSALDEVKLCMGGEDAQPRELFAYLRAAFREKRTTPQLLHAFYARKQLEGEDLREYSHALSTMLNAALQQSPNAVQDVQVALRDQFVEGVRDSILRRELRKIVRDRPRVTLFEVREEALLWCAEDRPRGAGIARSRYLLGLGVEEGTGSQNVGASSSGDLNAVLQEVVKAVVQQGKAIGELTNAVRNLTTQRVSSSLERPQRATVRPRYTWDGQPICLRCEAVGHIARQCTARLNQEGQVSASGEIMAPENRVPPLRRAEQ
ncbi:uncharacterized protein LOC107710775 [Sinocyclocheilus rhinocerous]|uniref:uncharacterized protein LOC107710775 n=1 Tax=Sinocyclocheilus rhinocerous TaxID=307959 RepID=UPI0007BAA210|nr:PREDICTED: uncharacterized protein LOC107710775 [Sinocyclocheilus rhinocerous]